ncbi:MAG: hypothetical protein M1818_001378 [Claussenomyces sp. TS43310]|nr:MAG: hypothetical protein M1818_001378 [Claussenomyces sp. TS43310]
MPSWLRAIYRTFCTGWVIEYPGRDQPPEDLFARKGDGRRRRQSPSYERHSLDFDSRSRSRGSAYDDRDWDDRTVNEHSGE